MMDTLVTALEKCPMSELSVKRLFADLIGLGLLSELSF